MKKLNDKTCFSCVHVQRRERRRDICGCLKFCDDPEDAEVIYNPMKGECPSWESADAEMRAWAKRWLN